MALKVFDLQCANGHVFEGWFASHDAYAQQHERGLLVCPVCQDSQVERRLSATRINLGKSAPAASPAGTVSRADVAVAPVDPELARLQAQWLRRMREMVKASENVGSRFSEEARRMHEGDAQERPIRGTATPQEREALAADGIDVMPVPDFLDDDRLQ